MKTTTASNAAVALFTIFNHFRGKKEQLTSKYRSELPVFSGDEGARTPNPCLAKAVLSQLSYVPVDH